MKTRRLVADVGGTNVRFAAADELGRIERLAIYQTEQFSTFGAALDSYLKSADLGTWSSCAMAAAGPVDGDRIKLTNNGWTVTLKDVSDRLGTVPAILINDLEAVAAALPHLSNDDYEPLGPVPPGTAQSQTFLALNVGTGFGAATVARRGAQWWTLAGEAGHMTLATRSADLLSYLPAGATVESVLSGDGVSKLHAHLVRSDTLESPEAIFGRAGTDPAAARTVQLITELLGGAAGDLALAVGAWGGVFLCGSVAQGWSRVCDIHQFRRAFENKGPLTQRLGTVPMAIVTRGDIALIGLAMLDLDTRIQHL